MRFGWPFFIFVVVEALLIGLFVGWISVTGVEPTFAPHGFWEYLLHRYQPLIAAGLALSGAVMIYWQLKESRKQHQADLRNAHRKEINALNSAGAYARLILRESRSNEEDIARLLSGLILERHLLLPPEPIDTSIRSHCDDSVQMFYNYLIQEVSSFIEWQNSGSIVEIDLWGERTPDFTTRLESVSKEASDLLAAVQFSITQLNGIITGQPHQPTPPHS